MKKNLCILLLISLISTFCPAIQSNAESTAAIENVSTGKKATSSLNYYSETYNPSKVNDGNLSTFWHPSTLAEGVTHHWVMIDLGKAYQLSEIEIYDSGNDDEMHRQNLEFQASNDESFGSYVTLDSITSAEESAEK